MSEKSVVEIARIRPDSLIDERVLRVCAVVGAVRRCRRVVEVEIGASGEIIFTARVPLPRAVQPQQNS